DAAAVRGAELIAIYLPMHTATRLACKLIPSLRAQNAGAHICCYGLYAPMNAEYLQSLGVGAILGGEFEGGLVRLAERLGAAGELRRENKIFPQGLKPGESRAFMSEPFEAQDELKLRTPNASKSESPGGDALKRAPTTFVATQAEPIVSMERLKFEVPDRRGLAPIAKYAHLIVPGGGDRVV